MSFPQAVVVWLTEPARWTGADGIPTRVVEHLQVSAVALLAVVVVAVPVGLALGHCGRGGFIALNVANVGRALPSMALLALVLPVAFALGLGLGFWPTVLAMIPLGVPPVLTNSYIGVRQVDRSVVETARAMGMGGWDVLRHAELPLALPLVIAGVRNAAVAIVATATLGALVAGGGLGRYIVDGLAMRQEERLFVGALLVALLAIGTEAGFGLLERRLVSPGLRIERQAVRFETPGV